MNLLVSGSTGLIGSRLIFLLGSEGHHITRLVRSTPRPGEAEIHWDPRVNSIDTADLENLDGVVHLAGANIASSRWTEARKAEIRDSRIKGTRLLCETLGQLSRPPRVLVCASAVGYYGDCGDEVLREGHEPGQGFLAEVCQAWEEATVPALEKNIRVVHLRFGLILSPAGGALARMLLAFRLGLGGKIGHGRQYISWIALDDAVGAIRHALMVDALQGPVNAVAPNPVTNARFTRILGRVLGRPSHLRLPALVARLALGEMADALLLASTRVEPARLLGTGYEFLHPELEGALQDLLKGPGSPS